MEELTKMSEEVQKQHLRLFVRMELKNKYQVLKDQKHIFHKLRIEYEESDNIILTLASLVLAINQEVKSLNSINFNMIRFRRKKIKRRVKRERLLNYWSVIKTLRGEEQMSFRDIANYLQKYYRFEVAHSTIFELWHEIEENKKRKNK